MLRAALSIGQSIVAMSLLIVASGKMRQEGDTSLVLLCLGGAFISAASAFVIIYRPSLPGDDQ